MEFKVLILTSNSLRHKYFAQALSKHFDIKGVISEPKKNYYNKVKEDSKIVSDHFDNLSKYEEKFFKNAKFPDGVELLQLDKTDMNNQEVVEWAEKKEPDLIFLFGTVILKDRWLNSFKDKIINLHLGLSPFYRGSATLFWPIFNNELECLGVTIHIAAKKVDAGVIIGRVKPKFEIGDNYYIINYKAIKEGIDNMADIVTKYLNGSVKLIEQDLSISKLYKKSDFTEEKLIEALANIGNGLTVNQITSIETSNKCSC